MQDETTFTVNKEQKEVTMTKTFNAPREKVFKAFTSKDQIIQWWGPGYLTTEVDKMDVKPGGLWRFIQRDKDGNEFAFNGKYLEVTEPEKLVYTFEFEPMAGHILEETIIFEEEDGKTKVTDTSRYATIEDLEGMIQSGMEGGARESMDRLETLMKKS